MQYEPNDTHADPKVCTRSLKLLGDYWTLNVIGALGDGELRYCDLQRAAGGINPVTLGSRLRKLQTSGLIERIASVDDIAVSYRLTPLGRAALPVLEAVDSFSRLLPQSATGSKNEMI
jgi:DNA-binding HxlR family transcriptional regulator